MIKDIITKGEIKELYSKKRVIKEDCEDAYYDGNYNNADEVLHQPGEAVRQGVKFKRLFDGKITATWTDKNDNTLIHRKDFSPYEAITKQITEFFDNCETAEWDEPEYETEKGGDNLPF